MPRGGVGEGARGGDTRQYVDNLKTFNFALLALALSVVSWRLRNKTRIARWRMMYVNNARYSPRC